MEFKIDISKIRTNDLNALDADIQKIMETPSQSKIVNALWATLQKRVKDELLLRLEDMRGDDMSKLKSILTKYMDYCIICGRQREEIHHILEGTARRQLSDADGLVIPLCSVHHNQSGMSVHQNKEMKTLCHIIGELAWEREYLAEICAESDGTAGSWVEDAKTAFRKRYGQNFL